MATRRAKGFDLASRSTIKMTTETTTTETPDIGKLQTQANELRGAMVEALGKAEDAKVRRLSNELAAVNKSILDIEVTSQVDIRQTFLEAMHDTLNDFEIDGLELSVKFDDADGVSSVVYTMTDGLFDRIKAAVATVDRPTSATKWSYGWADGDDGKRYQDFEFGTKAKGKSTRSNGAGTRTVGWVKDGTDVSLGDAYDAVATAKHKSDLAKLTGGSATHAFKSKVVTEAGYTKK